MQISTQNASGKEAGYTPGWNDPPPVDVLKKKKKTKAGADSAEETEEVEDDDTVDWKRLTEKLEKLMVETKEAVTSKGTAMHQKMLEDAERKLEPILADLSTHVSEMQAVEMSTLVDILHSPADTRDYGQSAKVVQKLMAGGYSSDGTQWVLGLKRINDIHKSLLS